MRYHENITLRLRLTSGRAWTASRADRGGLPPWTGGHPRLVFAPAESKDRDRIGSPLPGSCGFNPYRGLGP
jgi:hypothetical protein